MKISARNVVAGILLIPTTILCALLSIFFLILASVGAPLSVLVGVLAVAWAANVAMWCIFLRASNGSDASAAEPVGKRWRYYMLFSVSLVLIAYAVSDAGGEVWGSICLGWIAFTLVYFSALLYCTPTKAVSLAAPFGRT